MDNHGVARSARKAPTEAEKKRGLKRIEQYRELVAQTLQAYRDKDYSADALTLTSALLSQNLEFYTVWNYRRLILQNVFSKELTTLQDGPENESSPAGLTGAQQEISMLLREELQFLLPLQRINPKVYWLWNHRSWALSKASEHLPVKEALQFWQEELGLVSKMLGRDDRNFHGWGYRREVVNAMEALRYREIESAGTEGTKEEQELGLKASLAQQEFDYADKMVRSNFSNFSAWHHRLQQLHKILDSNRAAEDERRKAFEDELNLASELLWAATDPKDQSLWFYHGDLMATLDPDTEEKFRILKAPTDDERRAYIEAQMAAVKEILEDNEDCKWIYQSLLGMTKLYVKIGGTVDKSDVKQWFAQLHRLDPLRRGRWQDLEKQYQ